MKANHKKAFAILIVLILISTFILPAFADGNGNEEQWDDRLNLENENIDPELVWEDPDPQHDPVVLPWDNNTGTVNDGNEDPWDDEFNSGDENKDPALVLEDPDPQHDPVVLPGGNDSSNNNGNEEPWDDEFNSGNENIDPALVLEDPDPQHDPVVLPGNNDSGNNNGNQDSWDDRLNLENENIDPELVWEDPDPQHDPVVLPGSSDSGNNNGNEEPWDDRLDSGNENMDPEPVWEQLDPPQEPIAEPWDPGFNTENQDPATDFEKPDPPQEPVEEPWDSSFNTDGQDASYDDSQASKENDPPASDWSDPEPEDEPVHIHHYVSNEGYFEEKHPHRRYDVCTECKGIRYTGTNKEYYEKCEICNSQKSQDQCPLYGQHQYGTLQYEKDHPHKEYYRCDCGYAKYTGTTFTVSSCPNCQQEHVHDWRKIIQKTSLINQNLEIHTRVVSYKMVCATCGAVGEKGEDRTNEPHVFSSKNHIEAEHHPEGHYTFSKCECGATQLGNFAKKRDCCQCFGHLWGEPYQKNGQWMHNCTRNTKLCKETEFIDAPENETQPSEPQEHEHQYGVYYDENLMPHQFCVICFPRTEEEKQKDEENILKVLKNDKARLTAEKVTSLKDGASILLSGLKERNDAWYTQTAAYTYKFLTFQWSDIAEKAWFGTESADNARKLSIQCAVSSIIQSEDSNLDQYRSYDDEIQQFCDEESFFMDHFNVIDNLADFKKAYIDQYGEKAWDNDKLSSFLKKAKASKNFSPGKIKSFEDALNAGKQIGKGIAKETISSSLSPLSLISYAIDSGCDIADYLNWSTAQKELLFTALDQADKSIVLLSQIKNAYPDDNLLVEYCNSTIIDLDRLRKNELFGKIGRMEQGAEEILSMLGKNAGETIVDNFPGAALSFLFGSSGAAVTAAGAIAGLAAEWALGTDSTTDAVEDINRLYMAIEKTALNYHNSRKNSALPEAVKRFGEYYMLFLKIQGLEMAKNINKGEIEQEAAAIEAIYENYLNDLSR